MRREISLARSLSKPKYRTGIEQMQTGKIVPSRDVRLDINNLLRAMADGGVYSIRGLAQKLGIYPSAENLQDISSTCRALLEDGQLTAPEVATEGNDSTVYKMS